MTTLASTKVVFFGTSPFAVPILAALHEQANVIAVVTQPDAPVGRKQVMHAPPVAQWVQEHASDTPLLQYETLKSDEVAKQLKDLGADCAVVAAYGKIIPQQILELFPHGCINVHASRLPQYRGASPIQAALRDGLPATGNTIMLMDAQMDHGPLLAQSTVAITPDDTFTSLQERLALDGASLLLDTLERYLNGEITPQEQDHEKATYVSLIRKEDGLVNPAMTREQIRRAWRAYVEWPQLTAYYIDTSNGQRRLRLDVLGPSSERIQGLPEGVVCHEGTLYYQCADGALQLEMVTPEGKKTMSGRDFCNGLNTLRRD